jgi:ankyrin repeat protein
LQGRTALRLAAGRGYGATVQLLIDAKANIDIQQVVITVDFVINNSSFFFLLKKGMRVIHAVMLL